MLAPYPEEFVKALQAECPRSETHQRILIKHGVRAYRRFATLMLVVVCIAVMLPSAADAVRGIPIDGTDGRIAVVGVGVFIFGLPTYFFLRTNEKHIRRFARAGQFAKGVVVSSTRRGTTHKVSQVIMEFTLPEAGTFELAGLVLIRQYPPGTAVPILVLGGDEPKAAAITPEGMVVGTTSRVSSDDA